MDKFTWIGKGILLAIFLSACGQKSVTQVFPEYQKTASPTCATQRLKNQFIIQWEDGHFTKAQSEDSEVFVANFVQPNLQKIRHVEHDQKITLNQSSEIKNEIHPLAINPAQWYLDVVHASDVWNQNILGEGVVIGVVDTYVDYSNKQLSERIFVNEKEIPNDNLDNDNNGLIDDYYFANFAKGDLVGQDSSSHGTHVAGIIAADPLKGQISGIAPMAKILPITFMNASGEGTLADAILALQYAANRGVKIINISWGGGDCSQALYNEFQDLNKRNILLLVAAGNGDEQTRMGFDIEVRPEYPASFNFPNQITIAASSRTDYKTMWSNMSWNLVHLAAPGEGIFSTVLDNAYATYSGTSMATPIVSGAAALLLSAYPKATPLQIKLAMMNSVDVIPNHEFRVKSNGRLNIAKALLELQNLMK